MQVQAIDIIKKRDQAACAASIAEVFARSLTREKRPRGPAARQSVRQTRVVGRASGALRAASELSRQPIEGKAEPTSGDSTTSPPPASLAHPSPRTLSRSKGGRTNWNAPAGFGMRFMAARNFGRVREVKARGAWEIDVRPHGRFRSIPLRGAQPIRLTSREMAESVLAQIRAEIQAGKTEWAAVAPYLPRASSAIDKVLDRWCDELRRRVEAKEIAPRTLKRIESYAQPQGHFSWLYGFSIYEVTPGHLSDWNLWLMHRGLHQNTRKHVVETMRTLFRWLHARGELESVPRFPSVAKRKHVPTVIAPDEQERILAAIPESERGIYMMAVEEVFRPGELRALNVSDYDFKTQTVTVRHAMDGDTNAAQRKTTKEDDVRVREVTERMAAWIGANVPPSERLKGTRPLFVNPDARAAPEGRYNAQAVRLGWKRAAKLAGLEHVGMYEGTKHSTLTEGRRRGLPLDQLQKAAGHSDPRSTEIYAELSQDQATRVLRLARKSQSDG